MTYHTKIILDESGFARLTVELPGSVTAWLRPDRRAGHPAGLLPGSIAVSSRTIVSQEGTHDPILC